MTVWSFGKDALTVESDETVYQGYADVRKLTFNHERFDGGRSQSVTRELFSSGDAVMIIPFDPASQKVLLIEQIRVAPFVRENKPWIFECIAGRIDQGESASEVARREAIEEAGCEVGELEEIGGFYQSPGIFAEHITYFCGKADLSGAGGVFGLDSEGEDIRAFTVSLEEALAATRDGRIVSAPTTLCLLWLEANRERLIGQWSQ